MKHQITKDGSTVIVHLSERLTSHDRGDFDRLVSELMAARPGQIEVNLKELAFMDSAGLGFLLTLREQAEAGNASVLLVDPKGEVRETLELARFDTLFHIVQRTTD
ncbi:STAS domain-containing protein [Roseospirillum parvum]|uniref:Anti-sigma factor antagonist n=1 Tax=Roseospirillum parvum TaxID=83401 RepID=A0A1G8B7F7_9PROT|nr:STAS domain-containing protein [Roseospirillum parvum]SDH29108.1 stage II sporulation protein AA (anti-sigma F factor antagonist) [Roseospirillum parvum]